MPVIFYPIINASGRKKISVVPSTSTVLTYTGTSLSPVWSDYNSEQLTISGTTSAINAGIYTATFTPTKKYKWADGTRGSKTVNWTIEKAVGSVKCVSEITLNATSEYKVINLTLVGDGEVSVLSNNENVARAEVNNDGVSITIYGVNQTSGSATITINVAEGTNYTAASKTIGVTAQYLSGTFSENTWASIAAACQSNSVPTTWKVGDTKSLDVDGYLYNIRIIGKNVDTYWNDDSEDGKGGEKAPLTFQFSQLPERFENKMVEGDINLSGWGNSYMRITVLPAISTSLLDVNRYIKPVRKFTTKCDPGGLDYEYTKDYLFLLSEYEALGTDDYQSSIYLGQYEYYRSNSYKKYLLNGPSRSEWLRTPNSEDYYGWVIYDKSINESNNVDLPERESFYFAPAFCF